VFISTVNLPYVFIECVHESQKRETMKSGGNSDVYLIGVKSTNLFLSNLAQLADVEDNAVIVKPSLSL
jgi:hypothetical protein